MPGTLIALLVLDLITSPGSGPSYPVRSQDQAASGAVAASLVEYLRGRTDQGGTEKGSSTLPATALCLQAQTPLDIAAVATAMAGTAIVPIDASRCSSKKVKTDRLMFPYVTNYYDPSGAKAMDLRIADVKCSGPSFCIVDIDGTGAGVRYIMESIDSKWHVAAAEVRWIV